jgi:hypothetical protein
VAPASHNAREAGRVTALQELGLAEAGEEKVAFPAGAAFNALAGAGKWGFKQLGRAAGFAMGGGPLNPVIRGATNYAGRGINAAMKHLRVPEKVRKTLGYMGKTAPLHAGAWGGFGGLMGGAMGYADPNKRSWDWAGAGRGALMGAASGIGMGLIEGGARAGLRGVLGQQRWRGLQNTARRGRVGTATPGGVRSQSMLPGIGAAAGAAGGYMTRDPNQEGIPWQRMAAGAAIGAGAGLGGTALMHGGKAARGWLAGGVTGTTGRLGNTANYNKMRMLSIPGIAGMGLGMGVIDPLIHGDGGEQSQHQQQYGPQGPMGYAPHRLAGHGISQLPRPYNPYYNRYYNR